MTPFRHMALLLGLVALVGAGVDARAADQAKVNEAVKKGADFLKSQFENRQDTADLVHGIGTASLAGLAMLEAGISEKDSVVQNMAQYVRLNAIKERNTYKVSLALVFLDRLGDRNDVPLIQVLGLRLYSGMNANGGWTYHTWPEIPAAEEQRLRAVLYNPKQLPEPGKLHPEAARMYQAIRLNMANSGRQGLGESDDNSNTQFAIVGLWIAARHGVKIQDSMGAVAGRYLRTQNPDGGWGYTPGSSESSTAMTCAGLLGLGVAAGVREAVLTGRPLTAAPRERGPNEEEEAGPDDPFLNPRKAAARTARPKEDDPDQVDEPEDDVEGLPGLKIATVEAGLTAVGNVIQSTPYKPGEQLKSFIGHGNQFYLLWSIERVAMAFNLTTIGDVNWYDWAVSHLLPGQEGNGAWGTSSGYGPIVNTSFAILVLTRANLISDLSGRMKDKVKDPGRAELRGGGTPLFAPERREPPKPEALPEIPAESSAPVALLPQVQDTGEAVKIALRLINAKEAEWEDRVEEARDSGGVMFTLGMAMAIGKLEGVRRKELRDALAERLVRMTAKTLRGMMRDSDAELRRAAVLAAAMKEDESHIPDLIDRLTDPSDQVVRAARAALRSLTNKDFGPEPGADQQARVDAALAWQQWHRQRR